MRLLEEYVTGWGIASMTLKAWLVMPSAEEPSLISSLLRVDVTEATNFPEDVFVWERLNQMLDNGEMSLSYRPVCVAKPSDLNVYPIKSPLAVSNGNPPYYRDNFVSFNIAAPELVLDTWTLVKEDVSNLIQTTMELGGP